MFHCAKCNLRPWNYVSWWDFCSGLAPFCALARSSRLLLNFPSTNLLERHDFSLGMQVKSITQAENKPDKICVLGSFLNFFLKKNLFICVYVHVHVVPKEARRNHQMPWSWSYSCLCCPMWAQGKKLQSAKTIANATNHSYLFFFNICSVLGGGCHGMC